MEREGQADLEEGDTAQDEGEDYDDDSVDYELDVSTKDNLNSNKDAS